MWDGLQTAVKWSNSLARWVLCCSCVWSLRAERGQQISVSWRLPSAAGARDVGGQAPRRPVVPCPATIVFVDGHDEDENTGRPPDGGHHDHGSTAPLHATTCSVGARNEPRLIYTSNTNQLYVRLTVGYIDRTSPQLSIGFYHLSVVPGGLHLNQDKPAVCPTHRYHPSQTAAARSCWLEALPHRVPQYVQSHVTCRVLVGCVLNIIQQLFHCVPKISLTFLIVTWRKMNGF